MNGYIEIKKGMLVRCVDNSPAYNYYVDMKKNYKVTSIKCIYGYYYCKFENDYENVNKYHRLDRFIISDSEIRKQKLKEICSKQEIE